MRYTLILALLWTCGTSAISAADGMSMPFMPGEAYPLPARWTRPDNLDAQDYRPSRVRIFEPGQRAILLFNGREEILCLSTEMHASEATAVLEVIPFPKEPTVSLGDFGTMQLVEKLMLDHAEPQAPPAAHAGLAVGAVGSGGPAARLTFQEQMGAHDIAVVEVLDARFFREWVDAFFAERSAVNAGVGSAYFEIVGNYLERGYTWFVFDTLLLTGEVQSRQPVQYRFATDHLYYPLLTSTEQAGETQVELLVITRDDLKLAWPETPNMRRRVRAHVDSADLRTITLPWAQFIGHGGLTLEMHQLWDALKDLREDLIVYPEAIAAAVHE